MTTRPPVLALFQRSLQAECRSGRTYLVRAVLAVLILFSLSRSHVGMSVVSAAGLRFLRSVVYINLVFITQAYALTFGLRIVLWGHHGLLLGHACHRRSPPLG